MEIKSMNELEVMEIGALEAIQAAINEEIEDAEGARFEALCQYDQDIQVVLERKYHDEM